MARQNHFVGRKREIRIFKKMLEKPTAKQSVLFLIGTGGIGKTLLLNEMRKLASERPNTLVPDLIDLSSTEHRSVDGIQNTIVTLLGSEHFVEFEKSKGQEAFKECLQKLCHKHSILLVFDTFEQVATDNAGEWLLSGGESNWLSISGLLCIIGGRDVEDASFKKLIKKNKHFKVRELQGFNTNEALELFNKFWRHNEPPSENEKSFQEFMEDLVQKTGGHPLLLEMTFAWLIQGMWNPTLIRQISKEKFEEELMNYVRLWGEQGLLNADVHGTNISSAVYQTMVCMAYMDRRFNERILHYLIDEQFIHLEGRNPLTHQRNILVSLEEYFFVKLHSSSELQLHDELRRLVMKHIWPFWENIETREKFSKTVLELYDILISEAEGHEPRIY